MGEGKKKPNFGWLCKIKYVAYFYDKTIFDTSPNNGEGTVELFIGDITWPEGLWKGMQHMRKNERAKIRIAKKHGFGRTGELECLRFPRGFSTSEEDAERRTKLTTKGIIYDCTMVDWIERMDMEANGLMYKQTMVKPPKKEYELPNEQYDECMYSMRIWQSPTDSLFDASEDFQFDLADEEEKKEDNNTTLMSGKNSFASMDQIKC